MRFWNRKKPHSADIEITDIELVEMAKKDKDAFGEIYERYIDRIYKYIYYRVGNQHDAEDLTSRVFFRALAHIDSFEDRGVPFQAWLYRIAHNLVANHHRDKGRRKIIPLEDYITTSMFSTMDSPERAAENSEDREKLIAAIRRLPEDRQQLILLKFIDRMSNAEIGEIMGRTEGAIKSLYHRTLTALREDLTSPLHNIDRKAK